MIRKKENLINRLECQTEWESTLQRPGLLVVDVYQDWSGPCVAVYSFLSRVREEIEDENLQFAAANCNKIESLNRYKNFCQPTFLIFGSSFLVATVRGADTPKLVQVIKKEYHRELKVLNGELERKIIKDPFIENIENQMEREEMEKMNLEEVEVEQQATVILIKPDARDKTEEIIEDLKDFGIEIIEREERKLTSEEISIFYEHLLDEIFYVNLVNFMTSDISTLLICAKGHDKIFEEIASLIGSKSVEDLKNSQSNALRAKYGTSTMKNALHAAKTKLDADIELNFFFPNYVPKKMKITRQLKSARMSRYPSQMDIGEKKFEHNITDSILVIRPTICLRYKDSILKNLTEKNFSIVSMRECKMKLDKLQVYYQCYKNEDFYPYLIEEMTSGPILAILVRKRDAIESLCELVGPKDPMVAKQNSKCLRGTYSIKMKSREDEKVFIELNCVHCPKNEIEFKVDLKRFFHNQIAFALIKPDGYSHKDEIIEYLEENNLEVIIKKESQLTPYRARFLYQAKAKEPYFNRIVNHITSGPVFLLGISGRDSIKRLRNLQGDPDPNKACLKDDRSIRAIYGQDIIKNAFHSCSTELDAIECFELFLGNEIKDISLNLDSNFVKYKPEAEMSDEEDLVDTLEPEPEITFENQIGSTDYTSRFNADDTLNE